MCGTNNNLQGNTSLHYAVSYGNFDIVSALLDSKVCDLNKTNAAGYTPVMLAALCPLENETHTMVVQRLFQLGDVNVRATQVPSIYTLPVFYS
jgi:ankyrin repeat protein